MNFGNKIAEYRRTLNWTQETLADQCSVTRQAVAKWEKGESMPDIYTISRLANLFSVSIEQLIHTDEAVMETQDFYIRRLQKGDKKVFCQLMYEHGVLGRTFVELNKYEGDDGSPRGDQFIVEEYYPHSEHIFLLIRRSDEQALGVFDLREVAVGKNEMSAYIQNGFEMDVRIFKDFFAWVRNEYNIRAATVSVWSGQEEGIFSSLGYKPADGLCSVALPL